MESLGFVQLKPPDVVLEPNKFPAGDGAPVDAVAGLGRLNAGVFAASSGGLGAKRLAPPPVLAPKVELLGGGPAGVVEVLVKLKRLLEPPAAGVVDPNNEGADVDGVDVLSGVASPENIDLGASAPP